MALSFLVAVVWIFSLCLHEFSHAVVAYWGGDKSVKEKGYLTLNPARYTDPGLTVVLPLIFLMLGGIALPGAAVYIDHHALRSRLWESAVAGAGPLATAGVTLILGLSFDAVASLPAIPDWLPPALALLVMLHGVVLVLNLLPLPGLDGYGIIEPWFPAAMRRRLRGLAGYSLILLFAALWLVPPLNKLLWDCGLAVAGAFAIPIRAIAAGYVLFRTNALLVAIPVIAFLLLFRRRNRHKS